MDANQIVDVLKNGWALALVLGVLILSRYWASVKTQRVGLETTKTNNLLAEILKSVNELKQGKPSQGGGVPGNSEHGGNPPNQRVETWLEDQMTREDTNHNHKEKMAWTATALYVPAILVFGRYANQYEVRWPALLIIWLLFFTAFVFVNMQFQRRWISAEKFNDLEETRRKLLFPNPNPEHNFASKTIKDWERQLLETKRWPKFPLEWLESKGARWRTELPSYVALLLTTVVATGEVFMKHS